MKRIIVLLVTAFVLSINSCNEGDTQENKQGQEKQKENQFPQNMQSYRYYQLLGKYIDAINKESSDYKYNRKIYDTDIFKPKEIKRIKSRIDKITKIPFGEKGLLKVTEYHMVLTPESMFNFIFYVDDKQQLYFSDSSSADVSLINYVIFTNKGDKLDIGNINNFYQYLERFDNLTSVFYDASRYMFHKDSDIIYINEKIQIRMLLNEKKDKYFMAIMTNGIKELFEFPKDNIGSEIYYNAINENIIYKSDDDYYLDLKIPEGKLHNRNTLISEYDYKNGIVTNQYLFCMMKYYWHLGVDAMERIYYYRSPAYPYNETPNNRQTDYTAFEPRFNTGEIQIYDIENQTLTILEHPFPEPEGAKPIWSFYVVQKDGTLYCQYILPDGNYIIKITPDWNNAEPYPEYTPTFLNDDWKK